jgi:hypothetical protein
MNWLTSVDDIRSSLQCNGDNLTISELQKAIAYEKSHQNRTTVIKLLESRVNKKSKQLLKH